MDHNNPLVSAIITTYKRQPSVVEAAIVSIENQTYDNIEIIIVDDNPNYSKDSSLIHGLCSSHTGRVKYLKQNGNKGACAARTLGIMNSNGDYIGFLDDDDLWMPDKIEKQLSKFLDDSVGVVFCNGIRRDEESGDERDYNPSLNNETIVCFEDMLCVDRIGSTSHPLIKKKCFEDVGLFWEEQPARQDYEMWLRITKKYKAVGISEKLFIHTIHKGDQISKDKKKAYIGFRNVYKRYLEEFRSDPTAENFILKHLLLNHTKFNIEVIKFSFRYFYTKIKLAK